MKVIETTHEASPQVPEEVVYSGRQTKREVILNVGH
jgi:hypothetical protein